MIDDVDVVVPFPAALVEFPPEEELPETEFVEVIVAVGVIVNTVTCVIVLVCRLEPRVSCTIVDVESWTLD